MLHRSVIRRQCGYAALWLLVMSLGFQAATAQSLSGREGRMTPIVRAVQEAGPSIVNIQGQKTVNEVTAGRGVSRQVNGMGTGVVIDPRGYILTNHHVVDGVKQIDVTLNDQRKYVAQLVAFDRKTDLAVIKINAGRDLPVIRIGTSRDLMPAETVIAVGNAFGYANTVTVGIISALHRDVEVSETQSYLDLIQTDASINPGNSGGPLLNIEGDMIGVNVAVRAGAQGIGFAIPVDAAIEIAASLMSVEHLEQKWHGITVSRNSGTGKLVVDRVATGSPAAACGLQVGDELVNVAGIEPQRRLDLERALVGLRSAPAPVVVRRNGSEVAMQLSLDSIRGGTSFAQRPAATTTKASDSSKPGQGDPRAWDLLGVALEPEPSETFNGTKYQGGLRVVAVREGSPAAEEGIVPGDILVGMQRWQTSSLQDVDYVINRSLTSRSGEMRFYIMRGSETLFGDIHVATANARAGDRVRR
jgi:serine protease Do